MQDNENKKKRAEIRYNEEVILRRNKESEIYSLNEELRELQKNSTKSEAKVKGLKAYEEYLESVLRSYPDQYSDLAAISQRHHVLATSRKNLDGKYESVTKEIAKLKDEIKQYEKEKNREIITLNTDVATLQEKLDV